MRVAISQPTYLPWLGYFDLIDQVDAFLFLDTVQFEKRSWQQRNRIKTSTGLLFLTVPASVKGHFEQRIQDVKIENPYFAQKHLRSIETNYRRAPFFQRYFPELSGILEECTAGSHLGELNVRIVEWQCEALGVKTQLLRASSMRQEGYRSDLLLKLCQSLKADSYVSALGSAEYLLGDIPQFSAAGIDVAFQNYEHPRYAQRFPPFCSHVSAIDLLFNEGNRSLEILRSGRRTSLRPAEVRLCGKEQVTST